MKHPVLSRVLTVLLSVFLLTACSGKAEPDPAEPAGTAEAPETASELPATDKSDETLESAEPAEADAPSPSAENRRIPEERPCRIPSLYPTKDAIVADVVATDEAYGADPTGETDSTSAIRKAVSAVSRNGGGTVFLPAGKYLVTGQIEIPAFVSLVGDWQDPDEGNEYGTILLDRQPPSEKTSDALFLIRGSAGVVGVTVYYPNQSLNDVKPYPFAFYTTGERTGGYMLATVQNCTVLNGTCGVGACVSESNAHEMMTIDHFRGTFLSVGCESYNEADVGTWTDICISPDYWAGISPDLDDDPPERSEIAAYTRENATGLRLGDLEWDQFAGIRVTDCAYGIRIVPGKRVTFAGEFYGADIRDCTVALQVDDLDSRWGLSASRCTFSGSEHAICNQSGGVVKLTDCTVEGEARRKQLIRTGEGSLSDLDPGMEAGYTLPAENFYLVKTENKKDIAADLQKTLDEAGGTGGIVYLPAGQYRLESPVTVPEGVELRGAASVPVREQSGVSKGTVLISSYGMNAPAEDAALITLAGKNSGLFGIRVFYTSNNPKTAASTPYCIRGTAEGVYCVNCSVVASGCGVDFTGCDRHYIRRFVGCCYDNAIRAGGKNGHIEGCLQNGNAFTRNGLGFPVPWIDESQLFTDLFPILRERSTFLILDGAEEESLLNDFAYGVRTVLELRNSKGVGAVNLGGDNIGDSSPLILCRDSELTAANLMRYNGVSYRTEGDSRISLYSRLSIGDKAEGNVENGVESRLTGISD